MWLIQIRSVIGKQTRIQKILWKIDVKLNTSKNFQYILEIWNKLVVISSIKL